MGELTRGPAAMKYSPTSFKNVNKKLDALNGKRLGGVDEETGEKTEGKFEALYQYVGVEQNGDSPPAFIVMGVPGDDCHTACANVGKACVDTDAYDWASFSTAQFLDSHVEFCAGNTVERCDIGESPILNRQDQCTFCTAPNFYSS